LLRTAAVPIENENFKGEVWSIWGGRNAWWKKEVKPRIGSVFFFSMGIICVSMSIITIWINDVTG
jgi:hypothetical protein